MSWAAQDPPLGEGHEQPDAGTVEQGMGQAQPRPGATFSAELVLPQKLGSANFKIPTRKSASNQPGDFSAASITGGNEDATGIIYICGRYSPPPLPDLTTHTMLKALQMRDAPTNNVLHHTRLTGFHSPGDGHKRPLPAPKPLQVMGTQQVQKVPQ